MKPMVSALDDQLFESRVKGNVLLRFRYHVTKIYYRGIFFVDKISTLVCKDILQRDVLSIFIAS